MTEKEFNKKHGEVSEKYEKEMRRIIRTLCEPNQQAEAITSMIYLTAHICSGAIALCDDPAVRNLLIEEASDLLHDALSDGVGNARKVISAVKRSN